MNDDRPSLLPGSPPPTSALTNLQHEIRTPLNALIGFSEMLLEDIGESVFKADVQHIFTCSKELLTRINAIFTPIDLEEDGVNLHEFIDRLQIQLLPLLNQLIVGCEQLMAANPTGIMVDLTLIHEAARSLLELLQEMIRVSSNPSTAT